MATMLKPSATATRPPGVPRALTESGWILPIGNAAAWVVFLWIATAVQPAADPAAAIDFTSAVLSLALVSALYGSVFGLVTRSRWAYTTTAIGGLTIIGGAVWCFATGHTGAWIVVQGLAGAGLATTGIASSRISG